MNPKKFVCDLKEVGILPLEILISYVEKKFHNLTSHWPIFTSTKTKVDTDNITRSNQKENVQFTNKSRIFYFMYISLLLIIKLSFEMLAKPHICALFVHLVQINLISHVWCTHMILQLATVFIILKQNLILTIICCHERKFND
jgi:hypothetical protein